MKLFKPAEAFIKASVEQLPIQYSADKVTWLDLTKDKLHIMGAISFMDESPYTFRLNPDYIYVKGLVAKKPKFTAPTQRNVWVINGDNQVGIDEISVGYPQIFPKSHLGYFDSRDDLEKFVAIVSLVAKEGLYIE